MNFYKIIFSALLCLLLISCGGSKKVAAADADASAPAEKIINLHQENTFEFTTLASRVGVLYEDEKQSQSITVSLRMKKDETIWVSASILGITLAKILITPNNVSYYETINKTYFDGDFALLSEWLGTEINFEMAQNLLLGQSVFEMEEGYTLSVMGENYRLQPQKDHELFRHLLLINAGNLKAASQQIIQPQEQRMLKIDYPSYQTVNHQPFPKEIKIHTTDAQKQMRISLEYRNVDWNASVSFPFKIPDRYDEIVIN